MSEGLSFQETPARLQPLALAGSSMQRRLELGRPPQLREPMKLTVHGSGKASIRAVHTCFLAREGEYERWKDELTAKGVEIVKEIEWERGPRSFYFEDPAGNLLEIDEGDMWPA